MVVLPWLLGFFRWHLSPVSSYGECLVGGIFVKGEDGWLLQRKNCVQLTPMFGVR
jgi:hypothetical protein